MPRSKGRTGRPWQRTRHHIITHSNGLCSWCHQPVDRTLPGTHPDGPTIDHTLELAAGGHPTDPANLSLMHKRCNEAKERARRHRGTLNASRRW